MSIIYEALKKVQGNSQESDNRPKSHKVISAPLKKSRFPAAAILIPAVLIITMLSMEFAIKRLFIRRISREKTARETADIKNNTAALPGVALIKEEPKAVIQAEIKEKLPEPSGLPALTLNGIVLSEDGGNIALINEQILRAGDTIEGAVIKTIGNNSVVLNFKDQEIILKTK